MGDRVGCSALPPANCAAQNRAICKSPTAAAPPTCCSEEAASDLPHSYTTARTLLSILRIGQALARLRFADSVEQVGQKIERLSVVFTGARKEPKLPQLVARSAAAPAG